MTTFIGIDMAWRIDGNHSGLAVMSGDAHRVRLAAVSAAVSSMAGVVEFVRRHLSARTVIAIDASLVVNNVAGLRPCEKLIAQTFGRYHASCHPTNLGRPHARTGMRLVGKLGELGVRHDFQLGPARQRPGRWVFEVYPHPAMVRIFGLDRIIKYKKGTAAARRAGLAALRHRIRALASGPRGWVESEILNEVLEQDLEQLRGAALKCYEDTLDAIFCAFLAWHCWRWGAARNDMFGTLAEGYIVVPKAGASPVAIQ